MQIHRQQDESRSMLLLVRTVFDAVEPGIPLTLEVTARATKLSKRTIQRELSDEGTTFSQVLDDWRAERALKLLANPDISMSTISRQLHYAQLPNFIRAFGRWTGTSPRKYLNDE